MLLFQSLLILLVCAVLLTALARYLQLPYPSMLALGGTALAFVPNGPTFSLDPELTLALFVAPALLDAAFDTSLARPEALLDPGDVAGDHCRGPDDGGRGLGGALHDARHALGGRASPSVPSSRRRTRSPPRR